MVRNRTDAMTKGNSMIHGDTLNLQFEDAPQAWEQVTKTLLPHECDQFVAEAGRGGWTVVTACNVPVQLKQRVGVIVDALGGEAGGTQPQMVMAIMLFLKRPLRQLSDEAKTMAAQPSNN